MQKEWNHYIKSIRLKKLIYLSKEANFFIHGIVPIQLEKTKEKRVANFGNRIHHYELERWELVFFYQEKRYRFYKMKSAKGGDINIHWTYEGNETLFSEKEEEHVFKKILEDFPFDSFFREN